MNLNEYGITIPEGDDLATASACRQIAEQADERIFDLLSGLHLVKNLDMAVVVPAADYVQSTGVTWVGLLYNTTLGHTCKSDPGDGAGFSIINGGVQPGLFLIGATAGFHVIGAGVTGIIARLDIRDPRGPKATDIASTYVLCETSGANPRTEEYLNPCTLVQIHSESASIYVTSTISGAGNVTVRATHSRLWFIRLGDLVA